MVKSVAELPFEHLLQSVREGSDEAAAELVRRYGPWMRKVVANKLPQELRRQFDSSDFTQTAWSSIFANRSEFGRFHSPHEFLRYAAKLAHNKVAIEARRRLFGKAHDMRQERTFSDVRVDIDLEPCLQTPTPSQEAMAGERWSGMIANQSPDYRSVLELRREGRTFGEIAEHLSLSESHVRRLYRKALFRESHG
jgi:RNA polymerase sigma factor (sigma-70 family)